jgi:hypothetical protein
MSLLNSTKEKVTQIKDDLLAKSIMEQISNGGADYVDGFERMYSRLKKSYISRNEYYMIFENESREEYFPDGYYTWRATGNIYFVTIRNELGVSFQIFDTLTSTRLTCSLEYVPAFYPNTYEIHKIETMPEIFVTAYWKLDNIKIDNHTNIYVIDNSDRPFVEELFKEGLLTQEFLSKRLIKHRGLFLGFGKLYKVDNM